MELLAHSINNFNGVIIDPAQLPDDPAAFRSRLDASLTQWRADGRQVVWMEAPASRAALIPLAVDAGFTFHHSQDGYLMMTFQLQEGAFIPYYATHYIGAGGVVINARQEILVVCERFRRGNQPYYKLPGGALLPGEHLMDGVIREVREETGVEAKFEALACFRHWHGYRYGKSDIYFVCRLSPLTETIVKDDYEIEECKWMPVAEYMESDAVGLFNRRIVRAALNAPGIPSVWVEGYNDPTSHEFFFPEE
ncbi:MAG: NUDIX domain-containing protein [Caldilineaceae bacterium]|nr:NUDIX domain-containing protein [Caldilineaceae bacterium]